MKILSLRIRAFKSLRDTNLKLGAFKGLTGIEGRNNSGGATSNGAGKSSIIEFITWIFYGRTIEEAENVDAVCNRQTGIAEGEIDLELPKGRVITIIRKRGSSGASLDVTGFSGGTPRGKQESLERLIGMDYGMWVRVVAFGGPMSAFCRMADAQKKEVLENLLDYAIYEVARKRASEKAKDVRNDVSNAEHQIANLKEIVATSDETLAKLKTERREHRAKVTKRLRQAHEKYVGMVEAILPEYEALLDLGIAAEDSRIAHEQSVEAYKAVLADAKAKIKKSEEVQDASKENLTLAEERLRAVKNEIKQLISKDHPDMCATCGQKWPHEVTNHKPLLEVKRNAVNELNEVVSKCRNDLARADEAVERFEKALEEAEDKAPKTTDAEQKWRQRLQDIEKAEIILEAKRGEWRALKSNKNDDPYKAQIDDLAARVETSAVKLKEAEASIVKNRTALTIYEFWMQGFGKQGIPSFLIDDAIPFLNESVQRMADILTDGALEVYFDPGVEKGEKQLLQVVVNNRHGGEGYKSQSKGEKARVDVCVLMAIRQLMASRLSFSFDQLFIDELFDGMDDEGIERVAALMRSEFPNTSTFLITHKDVLKGMMENTIFVTKRKRVSTITFKRS